MLVRGFGCQCSFVIEKGEVEALGRAVDPNKTTWNAGGFAGRALCDRERCERLCLPLATWVRKS